MRTLEHLAVLTILTFVVPMTQWFVGKFVTPTQYVGLISSIIIILFISLWYRKTRSFSLLPASSPWKIFCYFIGIIVFLLLIFNILNQPISKITGQARSLFEVVDVIVFASITEELVFRGVMWSIFEKFSQNSSWGVVTLIGTSLLFGVEHLGYWAQSHWPLPLDAMIHSILMVVAGAYIGIFRMASRSLAAPIAVHMLANAAILLAQ